MGYEIITSREAFQGTFDFPEGSTTEEVKGWFDKFCDGMDTIFKAKYDKKWEGIKKFDTMKEASDCYFKRYYYDTPPRHEYHQAIRDTADKIGLSLKEPFKNKS
mgnify:CR=1 FL=1